MPSDPVALLFGGVLALALLLAVLEWASHNRRMAVAALVLAAQAAAFFAFEIFSVRTSIRVDLLVTVPLITLAAAAVGVLAMLAPPLAARAVGAILTVVGAGTLGWSVWSFAVWTARSNLEGLARDEGRKLYWQETIRCQANFEKRFGPLRRRDSSCVGNLVVSSRSDSAYPYSRVVVRDDAQFTLLLSELNVAEDTIRPAAPLQPRADGSLYAEHPAVELRPASNGACEARISNDYLKRVDLYTLRRVELGSCPAPANSPVHFLGAWGSFVEKPTQLWLWETQGRGYALILTPPSNSVQRFTGTRNAQGAWQLRALDSDNPEGASTRIEAGHLNLSRGASEMVLDPGEVVTHPKIALAPVRDAALFERYFDTVFLNLNIP